MKSPPGNQVITAIEVLSHANESAGEEDERWRICGRRANGDQIDE